MFHAPVSWIPQDWRKVIGFSVSNTLSADRGSVWGNLSRYAKALGRTFHLPFEEQYLGLVSVLSVEHVMTLLRLPKFSCDPGASVVQMFHYPKTSSPLNRLLYVDAKTVLPESLLLLTDKMGMATSLEIRVPFLDNRVVDFVCRIPAHYRMRGFALKRLLKSALKGVVPDMVLLRAKRGFGTPMGSWMRADLRPLLSDMLAENRLRRDGLYNLDFVKQLLVSHDEKKEDYTEAIFALLVFEVWRDRFKVRLP
jgi:asparagine synthase (glutamine-hydrolysing)